MLLLDGNRDRRLVLFDHDRHRDRMGGEGSCLRCHHLNLPLGFATSCHLCHADMYEATDTFSHASHVRKLGGNEACEKCHADVTAARTERTATGCPECHRRYPEQATLVRIPEGGRTRLAPGYMQALHGLCLECHRREDNRLRPGALPVLAQCTTCHQGVDPRDLQPWLPHPRETAPQAGTDLLAEARPGR